MCREKLVQEDMDTLLDNGIRGQPMRDDHNKVYKSFSDVIEGKEGRFCETLLGKRVDYSGRSIIVAVPLLSLHRWLSGSARYIVPEFICESRSIKRSFTITDSNPLSISTQRNMEINRALWNGIYITYPGSSKNSGFQQAIATSISLGIDDLLTIPSKGWLVQDAEQQSLILGKHHHYGNVLVVEKLLQSIEIWSTSWICRLCYGRSPTHGALVELGEAVGIITGQSIGEPGTQLTLRTFHTGGVFTGGTAEHVRAPSNGKIKFNEDLVHPTRTRHGHPAFLCSIDLYVTIESEYILHNVNIPPKSLLLVQNDQYVESEQVIAEIRAGISTLNFKEKVRKHIYSDSDGEMYWSTDVYHAPEFTYGKPYLATPGATVHGHYGKTLYEGDTLVTFIYEKSRSGDITQGLPKVEQVLEVRSIDSISMNLEKRVEGWNKCITRILGIPWGFLIGAELTIAQSRISLVNKIQ
ncbi:hypothetical protein FXO38_30175 [Capsicum annuum]|nr:hypothetical protein FXO38_30175 [Capsicum annuum]KAF3625925.1 hypothetical protein FXO37_30604 [Capsicum annuum]